MLKFRIVLFYFKKLLWDQLPAQQRADLPPSKTGENYKKKPKYLKPLDVVLKANSKWRKQPFKKMFKIW